MTPICGAVHPVYKKIFCCRLGNCQEMPHTAPRRRGYWVTWYGGTRRTTGALGDSSAAGSSPAHRAVIAIKSGGKCWYCGVEFVRVKRTRDHVVPRSKGGLSTASNLVLACEPCNTEKGNKSLEIYRRHIQQTRKIDSVVFYGESVQTATSQT